MTKRRRRVEKPRRNENIPEGPIATSQSEEDTTMSRRSLLKLVGLGTLGGGGLIATGKNCESPDSAEDKTGRKEAANPLKPELPEQLGKKQAIQMLIESYNKWLNANLASKSGKHKGMDSFVTLYNHIRGKFEEEALPPLSREELDSDDALNKLHMISERLSTDDYYLKLMPLSAGASMGGIPYMGAVSGKIIKRTQRVTTRDTKTAKYTHIVVDKEKEGDPNDRYFTAATNVSAMTYKHADTDEHTVLQLRGNYRESAEDRYKKLKSGGGSAREVAARAAFKKYLSMPPEEAKKTLTEAVMQNSLKHEEQHVMDGVYSDQALMKKEPKQLIVFRMIAETRGLLAGMAVKDSKAGAYNLIVWMDTAGENGRIGSALASTLNTATGKNILQLIEMPEKELQDLAVSVLAATDDWYEAARSADFNLRDSRLLLADQRLKFKLLGMRSAKVSN